MFSILFENSFHFLGMIALIGMVIVSLSECIVARIYFDRSYPWNEAYQNIPYLASQILAFIFQYEAGSSAERHWLSNFQIVSITTDSLISFFILFILVDLCNYWYHRWAHRCNLLWASHSVHHTIEHFSILNGLRVGLTEMALGGWLVFLPLIFIGYAPAAILNVYIFNLFIQMIDHVNLPRQSRWLAGWFCTPDQHMLHHATNPEYRDRNYGGTLLIWDRLFGTYVSAIPGVTLKMGLVGDTGEQKTLLRLEVGPYAKLVQAFRRAQTWRARLLVVFGPAEFAERVLANPPPQPSPQSVPATA